MIRRFYILPLRAAVRAADVQQFIDVLRAADRFIPGLQNSSADMDLETRTVLWENSFVDEASYAGPYMVHPFHIGAIDNFVMADSPACLTQDIFTTRYQMPAAVPQIRRGVRRVLLMNVSTDADASALEALAAHPSGMAASAFGADDVGWVSAKGRAWTHVWEQTFADIAELQHYLTTRDGIACSSKEGFTRLGVDLHSLKVLTCPFELTPAAEQTPAATPPDDTEVLHSITARLSPADVEVYIDLLERLYDPFMAGAGAPLVHRSRATGHGDLEDEVHSTWRLDRLAAYSDLRAKTFADPGWNSFVREAMPLLRGGSRRFHRTV